MCFLVAQSSRLSPLVLLVCAPLYLFVGQSVAVYPACRHTKLDPAQTDFRGPIDFICDKGNSVIATNANKRKQVERTKIWYLLQVEFR